MRVSTLIKIGTIDEFQVNIGKLVEIEDHAIAVFRLADRKFNAVENRCPHKGGPLAEGIVSGDYVFCPLHDWKIDLKDGNVQAPDHGCVKKFDVTIEGEEVFITL